MNRDHCDQCCRCSRCDLFRMVIADMMQYTIVMTKLYYDDVGISSAEMYGSIQKNLSEKVQRKGKQN